MYGLALNLIMSLSGHSSNIDEIFKWIFEIYLAGGSLSNIDDGDKAEVGAGVPVAVAAEATEAGALYPAPTQ